MDQSIAKRILEELGGQDSLIYSMEASGFRIGVDSFGNTPWHRDREAILEFDYVDCVGRKRTLVFRHTGTTTVVGKDLLIWVELFPKRYSFGWWKRAVFNYSMEIKSEIAGLGEPGKKYILENKSVKSVVQNLTSMEIL